MTINIISCNLLVKEKKTYVNEGVANFFANHCIQEFTDCL